MITADPQRRVSTLARILDHVSRSAPEADRDLLLALAPVVYGDMPDPLALRLSPEAVSARLAGIFRFIARTMPPADWPGPNATPFLGPPATALVKQLGLGQRKKPASHGRDGLNRLGVWPAGHRFGVVSPPYPSSPCCQHAIPAGPAGRIVVRRTSRSGC